MPEQKQSKLPDSKLPDQEAPDHGVVTNVDSDGAPVAPPANLSSCDVSVPWALEVDLDPVGFDGDLSTSDKPGPEDKCAAYNRETCDGRYYVNEQECHDFLKTGVTSYNGQVITNSHRGWRGPIPVVEPASGDEPFSEPSFKEWRATRGEQPDPAGMSLEEVMQGHYVDSGFAAIPIIFDEPEQSGREKDQAEVQRRIGEFALPQITCALGPGWHVDSLLLRAEQLRSPVGPLTVDRLARMFMDLIAVARSSHHTLTHVDVFHLATSLQVHRYLAHACRRTLLSSYSGPEAEALLRDFVRLLSQYALTLKLRLPLVSAADVSRTALRTGQPIGSNCVATAVPERRPAKRTKRSNQTRANGQEASARAERRRAVVMPILSGKRSNGKEWTPGHLVTDSGVGKATIYGYLDGTRSWISHDNRRAIADALGLREEELPD